MNTGGRLDTIIARLFSQKFWPYLDMKLNEQTRELTTPTQLRLLGEHPLSNYG